MKRSERNGTVRRAAQRGAVMIEGVIVVTVITMAFGGGVFFHSLYTAKIGANRDARYNAWHLALDGCKKDFSNLFDDWGSKNPFQALISTLESAVEAAAVPGVFELEQTSGSATSKTVKAPSVVHPPKGHESFTFSTTHTLICNDKLQNTKEGVLEKFADAFKNVAGSIF
jgi:hypothetical protein